MDYIGSEQTWWLYGAATAAVVALVYHLLVHPMDWTRELCDVGFEPQGASMWGAGRRAREAEVRRLLRTRRMGKMAPVFPNGWFPVLEAARLPRGEVRHVAALGQSLAVFRTEAGQVYILDAHCPHMGANMGKGGSVKGDCLVCPFHEWGFDGKDGKCTSVPYASKVPEFARVRRWESMETNGYVFVWHHAEGAEPSWRPQPVPQVEDGSWTLVGRNEFIVSSHIQDIPENAADPAHLVTVHGAGMLGRAVSRHVWDLDWTLGPKPHIGQLNLVHQFEILGTFRMLKIRVRAHQVGPGYVEMFVDTAFGPIVILQSVVPQEPLLQKVIHTMYCSPWIVPYAKIIFIGECIMFERDICVWNNKWFEDKPILVKEETTISRYRRWYSQFYSENSPRHSFRTDTMEW